MPDINRTLEKMLEAVSSTRTHTPEDAQKSEQAKSLIRYLLRQQETDCDRRDPEHDHRNAWRRLRPLLVLTSLKPFLYDEKTYQALADKFGPPASSPTPKSLYLPTKFPNWGPAQFFEHLHKQIASETRIPDRERYYLMLALRLLEVSTRVPFLYRNPRFERKVWKHAHTQLKALGYMAVFQGEPLLKKKIKEFLAEA